MCKMSKKRKTVIIVVAIITALIGGLGILSWITRAYPQWIIERLFLNEDNAYCRLLYPNLNIEMPCFWTTDAKQTQHYVDLPDCAGITDFQSIEDTYVVSEAAEMFETINPLIVADHNGQGFKHLTNSKIGDTVTITFSSGEKTIYTVSDCFRGFNEANDITRSDGTSVLYNKPDLVLYTCMEDTYNI